MQIEWNAVGSIVAIAAAIVAVVSVYLEMRNSRLALRTQALLTLMDMFEQRRPVRIEAATKLIRGDSPNYALLDILDFLSLVAGLVEDGAIDQKTAYREFSWWIIRYWLAAQDAIRDDHRYDPESYGTIARVAHRLKNDEGYAPLYYSRAAIHAFLLHEAGIAPQEAPRIMGEAFGHGAE